MEREGVIKYQHNWNKTPELPDYDVSALIAYRNKCFENNWIGFDTKYNVGFGNISLRYKSNKQFFISGSQTGHLPQLNKTQLSFIEQYNIEQNNINSRGLIKASSESLTHAAIYELSGAIKAVIHIHHKPLWEKHLNNLPTTNQAIEYGTPAMASEVHRLFKTTKNKNTGVLIMGGHEDGIISWAQNFELAFKLLEHL